MNTPPGVGKKTNKPAPAAFLSSADGNTIPPGAQAKTQHVLTSMPSCPSTARPSEPSLPLSWPPAQPLPALSASASNPLLSILHQQSEPVETSAGSSLLYSKAFAGSLFQLV